MGRDPCPGRFKNWGTPTHVKKNWLPPHTSSYSLAKATEKARRPKPQGEVLKFTPTSDLLQVVSLQIQGTTIHANPIESLDHLNTHSSLLCRRRPTSKKQARRRRNKQDRPRNGAWELPPLHPVHRRRCRPFPSFSHHTSLFPSRPPPFPGCRPIS